MNNKNEKIIIVFTFLVILIYFLNYFNIDNIIKNILLINREQFDNIYKPNRIYRYNGKIYLLDTRRILEQNKNPLEFENFNEYQKYVLNLEDKYKKKLNIFINKNKLQVTKEITNHEYNENKISKNIKDILENDIKDLEIVENINDNRGEHFKKIKECNKKVIECNINKNTPFYQTIYDPEGLKEFQKKMCKVSHLNKKQCRKFRDIIVDKDLRSKCFKPNNISSKECEQYHFFNNNIEDIKEECSRKDNNIDNFEKHCMLEDFFRENILYFN
jgi:hypothetical protein